MGESVRWALVGCAVFIVLSSAAAAIDLDARLEFSAPARAQPMASWEAGGAFLALYGLAAGVPSEFSMEGRFYSLHVTERTITEVHIDESTSVRPPPPHVSERKQVGIVNGSVRSLAWSPNHTLVIGFEDLVRGLSPSMEILSPVSSRVLVSADAASGFQPFKKSTGWPNIGSVNVVMPTYAGKVPRTELAYKGNLSFYAAGVDLRFANESETWDTRTGTWTDRTSGPAGPWPAAIEYRTVAVTGKFEGTLQLRGAHEYSYVVAERLALLGVQNLSVPLAGARIQAGNESLEYRGDHVDILGEFDLRMDDPPVRGSSRMGGRVVGDVTLLVENRSTSRVLPTQAVVVGAVVLGWLALAAAIVSGFRRGVVWTWIKEPHFRMLLGAGLYTRISRQNALRNPVRRRLMEMLDGRYALAELSVIKKAAANATGRAPKVIQRHIERLHRVGLVAMLAHGGRRYVGRNGGESGPNLARAAAAVIQHPTGLAVAEAIADAPGLSRAQVIAKVQERKGVSPGTVKYWLRKFVEFHWRENSIHDSPPQTASRRSRPEAAAGAFRLVERRRAGRQCHYHPSATLLHVLSAHRIGREGFGGHLTPILANERNKSTLVS